MPILEVDREPERSCVYREKLESRTFRAQESPNPSPDTSLAGALLVTVAPSPPS